MLSSLLGVAIVGLAISGVIRGSVESLVVTGGSVESLVVIGGSIETLVVIGGLGGLVVGAI